jgi:hypothetical protein
LFDRIKVPPLGADKAPRGFDEYKPNITIDADNLPAGVTLHRMVG